MANERLPPFLSNAHGQMGHPKAELLANVLRTYDLAETIALVAGLSTAPRLQANSYRIELLTQIAVAVCDGSKRPTWRHLKTWLNRQLGTYDIAMLEDPAEDVFITNVISPVGDFRVIGGLWEAGDSAATLLVETHPNSSPNTAASVPVPAALKTRLLYVARGTFRPATPSSWSPS